MKLAVLSLLVAFAAADNLDLLNLDKHVDFLVEKFYPQVEQKFHDAVRGVAPDGKKGSGAACDEKKYLEAARNFHDNLGLPAVVTPRAVFRKIFALIMADGAEGHKQLAKHVIQYIVDMKGNMGCYAPQNLRKLGYPIKAILPIILKMATTFVNAINTKHLVDDYSCYVKTTMDTKAEELGYINLLGYIALATGRGNCKNVLTYTYVVTSIYNQECGPNVAKYVYGSVATPLTILFPYCAWAPVVAKEDIPPEIEPAKTETLLKKGFNFY
jgi:hypothetical protein